MKAENPDPNHLINSKGGRPYNARLKIAIPAIITDLKRTGVPVTSRTVTQAYRAKTGENVSQRNVERYLKAGVDQGWLISKRYGKRVILYGVA